MARRRQQSEIFRGSRWLRRIALTILAVLLLPVAVTAAYRFVPPPLTPLMVIRTIEGDGAERRWVALDALPAHVPLAVMAAEDTRFCEHRGFDWQEIGNAIDEARGGKNLRGASTLSMQLTRNLFLWPGGGWPRKIMEALWTPALEVLLGKRRIMELYLNVAETGPGSFGIEAAAQRHFNKSARRLTRREAARIAAILPNPRAWPATQASGYVAERAATLTRRMRDMPALAGCLKNTP